MDQRRRVTLERTRGELRSEDSPFYAVPPLRTYTRRNFEQLLGDLDRFRDGVFPYTVASPEDLQLDTEGKIVANGRRLLQFSWQRTTLMLGPGASRFLSEVGVAASRWHGNETYVDWPFARQIYNRLVETRFRMVRGVKLIANDDAKLVLGISGTDLRGGDLHEFIDAIEDARKRCGTGQSFYAASVSAHRLRLWYREPKPFASTTFGTGDPQPLYRGTTFQWAGWVRSAMRVTPCIITNLGTASAPRKKHGRMVHWKGSCNTSEAADVAEEMFKEELPIGEVQANIDRWMETKIGFPKGVDDAAVTIRFRAMLKAASGLLVPQCVLRTVLDAAMASSGGAGRLRPVTDDDRASCTVGHFLAKLLPEARSMNSSYQESCETFAYRILTGRQL